ncbi:MAG: hypothetical protein H0U59_12130 [Gemmatimonadaceae bacterium]|nr:hypothetical protein [Gemmatimonadaceae bacterium]
MSDTYRITTDYMCCGVVVDDGIVIEAAPIMGWSVGKTLAAVSAWVVKKQGTIEVLEPLP